MRAIRFVGKVVWVGLSAILGFAFFLVAWLSGNSDILKDGE